MLQVKCDSLQPLTGPNTPTGPKGKSPGTASRQGFTLIELLVVISIIALLIGILLPTLAAARRNALASRSLSNIRQMGIALAAYNSEHNQFYPKHSSPSSGPWPGYANRPRWADYLYQYVQDVRIYRSPLLTERELVNFTKPFAHNTAEKHGGYGYNFQYLGNSRFTSSFHALNDIDITVPVQTVTFGDTAGSRDGSSGNNPGDGAAAVYVLDPPLGSTRAAHPDGRPYYEGGSDEPAGTTDTYLWRSFPAGRNLGAVNIGFADGHGKAMSMNDIDDYDGNGVKDNGYWNGYADSMRR